MSLFFSPRRPGCLRIVTMLTENSERLCFFSGTCGASVRRRATSLCRLFLALSRAVFPTWSRAAIVNQSKPFFYFKLNILWIQSGTHMVLDCSVGTGLQQNLDSFLVVESGSNMKRRFPFLQENTHAHKIACYRLLHHILQTTLRLQSHFLNFRSLSG